MRIALATFTSLFLLGTAQAQVAPLTPTELGALFCKAILSDKMDLIEAYLSQNLATQIAHAEAVSAVAALEKPNEKPPLGDGVPWQAFPDQADACEVVYVNDSKAHTEIAIAHKFTEHPDEDFTDVLIVSGTGFDIQINDLRYADDLMLSDVLKEITD